jgi:hypothetical protein
MYQAWPDAQEFWRAGFIVDIKGLVETPPGPLRKE